jgi:hypothetical protein
MKYLKKFNENFYVGAVWTAGNRGGTNDINTTVTLPYRGYSYDDEEIAFKKGYEAYEKEETQNPYEKEQYPNPILIKAWNNGYQTAEKNKNF